MIVYLIGVFNGTMLGVVCYRNFYYRLYRVSNLTYRKRLEEKIAKPVTPKTMGEALFTMVGSTFSDSFIKSLAKRMGEK